MSNVLDAIVVGCGFGGVYNLYKLKQLGLSVKAFEKAPDVGGTWYWNQYPGATTDTTAEIYRYRDDKELLNTYPWSTRYLYRKDNLEYLKHFIESHNLGRHIQLSAELKSASFDAATSTWTVTFNSTGETYKTTYLILATGHLHTPNYPDIKGLEKFAGPVYHTGVWPEHRDLKGKKVGVIGTGSSGAQLMVNIADDVSHLVSFQRSSQHVVPHNNGPISAEEREFVNSNWDEIWKTVDNHPLGQNIPFPNTPTMSVSAEERERTWEEIWNGTNGVAFMYGPFGDIVTSEEANRELCAFFEKKIAQYISDPDKLKKLTPTELYLKRPVTMTGYYETFAKKHVDIVNYQFTPLVEANEKGLLTTEKQWDLDVIILATGYEAMDGSLKRINPIGTHGTLNETWAKGSTSYLGLSEVGFPNMFFSIGPQSPIANIPPIIEVQANFIAGLIAKAEAKKKENGDNKIVLVEAEEQAKDGWLKKCLEVEEGSLIKTVKSFITGNFVEGSNVPVHSWLGGFHTYQRFIKDVTDNDYVGFKLTN
ncbi:hypothetical protein TRIATDRAFT_53410 [Trichoderma atroviride IMI 206040]|uniref:Cyclohexanone monooxygenase n=1 Tax=Hypocrea atroviridis (strain ATCC 20476 / IMI 206040) TaxID=452589 RepID=G9NLP6_HYPAI|nr:uncharacterized protein TRIATDRAFT_53410 [Trichoderma atroviride IMI 206040]EHK48807.1 hypothetical protein TRIATDRAFT_53410 [Trichoderma atroviride IMI 206040]